MPMDITAQQARRLLLERNGLHVSPRRRWDGAGLAAAIEALGYVQVDSINTVERAHHHILFSRSRSYRPAQLKPLLEKGRLLFEHWTHDASIVPMAFFPYWRHRFARERDHLRKKWSKIAGNPAFECEIARVLDRIDREGPLLARNFEGEKPNTGWWDWHPSKTALEYLWRTGVLAVTGRDGFQKIYDRTKRVVPAHWLEQTVDHDAFVDWACRQALARLGIATRGQIAAFFELVGPREVEAWIEANSSDLVTVNLWDTARTSARTAYAWQDDVERATMLAPPPDNLRILSPFDPLLRDRARAHRLFGFHYRIEVFVPEAQRLYGYYVFPVLRGERMVGRIDMKAQRDKGVLAVRAFWPERGIRKSAALVEKLEAELERFRVYCGLDNVEFAPDWMRNPVAAAD